jgi:hypothetical protein
LRSFSTHCGSLDGESLFSRLADMVAVAGRAEADAMPEGLDGCSTSLTTAMVSSRA